MCYSEKEIEQNGAMKVVTACFSGMRVSDNRRRQQDDCEAINEMREASSDPVIC